MATSGRLVRNLTTEPSAFLTYSGTSEKVLSVVVDVAAISRTGGVGCLPRLKVLAGNGMAESVFDCDLDNRSFNVVAKNLHLSAYFDPDFAESDLPITLPVVACEVSAHIAPGFVASGGLTYTIRKTPFNQVGMSGTVYVPKYANRVMVTTGEVTAPFRAGIPLNSYLRFYNELFPGFAGHSIPMADCFNTFVPIPRSVATQVSFSSGDANDTGRFQLVFGLEI